MKPKLNKYRKFELILLFIVISIQLMLAQDFLPDQPGDPGGLSVPIDGGILMALLAGGGIFTMLFKKKNKEQE